MKSYDFPILSPVIDNEHNAFEIIFNGQEITITFADGDDYEIDKITESINSEMNGIEMPITISENANHCVQIKSTNDNKFTLNLKNNSIGNYLGFEKDIYEGSSEYTSELRHMFRNNNYYMFVLELSNTPICEITASGTLTQIIEKIQIDGPIKELTFQFRDGTNNDSELTDFYDTPHTFKLHLYSQK